MSDGATKIPAGMRAHAYAGIELILDLIYSARQRAPMDLESLMIFLTVSEASMRPMLLDPATPPEVLDLSVPPEQYRGSITRVLVADRLGLPRETVRRKVQKLLELGLVHEDAEGRVRTARKFADPATRPGCATASWRCSVTTPACASWAAPVLPARNPRTKRHSPDGEAGLSCAPDA